MTDSPDAGPGPGATAPVASANTPPGRIPVPDSAYPGLVALFAAVLLISNITASKGVALGPLVTDGAFLLFPLSYVIGDVLSECYGWRATRRAVWVGFAALVLAIAFFQVAIWLPPAAFYGGQAAFAATLGAVPRIVLAGLAGYLVGQLLNARVLVALKARTGERRLWARLLGSTVVGEFADTLVFCAIAASVIGVDAPAAFVNYVAVGFLWKTGAEVAVMPLTYRVIAGVKRREGYFAAA